MNADGSNLHNMFVSEPGGFGQGEFAPSWSPDGTKILYIVSGPLMDTTITVLDAAGVGPQQYLLGGFGSNFSEPKWSTDGRLIAYIRYSLTTELWVMNADGTNQSQMVLANVVNPQAPDFSPDGKLLTVVGQPAGVTGASKDLFAVPVPPAPLAASSTTTVTATRLTTTGGVGSSDWQKKLVTTASLSVSNVSLSRGAGVVASQPNGINCGTQCTMEVVSGTKVTLTATPKAGSKFANWAGACTGKLLTCTVTVDQQRLAVAYFKKK